ncbi:unnamed protein product [Paramecium pentaurelia]|uniref:Transmembrane protein n=1 Tax=Paramecium pentaurelia TaxID=43138 RepID=A0A8S1WHB6_9CILI|nr:unnamed protein product [Paramecium pentaurelia]
MTLFCQNFRKIRSNLKMRSQILLINAIIFTFTLCMLLIAYILNMGQSLSILNISSQTLMINELQNLLNTASNLIEYQILFFYSRSQITLTKLNILNQIVYNTDYQSLEKPQLCPYNATFFDSNHYYPLSCIIYHSLNDDTSYINSTQDYQLRNLSHLFNEMILSIDLTGQFIPNDIFMVSDSNPNEFAFYYPQWIKYKTYKPRKRSWYQSHYANLKLNPNNHTQLSEIYKYFNDSDVYSMTMSQSFFNKTKNVDGLFAADIQLQNTYFNNRNLNMMIVNYDGKLILSNYKNYLLANSTKYESFDDEKTTGFNKSDWLAILNFINHNKKESTCSSIYNKYKQLCLYNSAYQSDVFISAKQIKGMNYYLIVFNNIQDQATLFEMLNQLMETIYSQFRQQMLITGLICCVFTIISFLLIYLICRPMLKLIKLSNIYINSHLVSKSFKDQKLKRVWTNQEKFNNFIQNQVLNHNPQKTSNNLMIKLIQHFQRLFDGILNQQNKKSNQCFIIQSFNYPKTQHLDINISQQIKECQFENLNSDDYNLLLIYTLKQLKRQFSL